MRGNDRNDDQVEAWLEEYRQGHVEALGRIETHYRKALYAYIFRMTNGGPDVDEIYQEVWLRAIRRVESLTSRQILGWLFGIAHNYIIDRARKNRIKVDPHKGEDKALGMDSWTSRVPYRGMDPGSEVAGRDLGFRIELAVSTLPKDQQEVFLLRFEGQLSFKDIARIQATNVRTALSRMQYALNKLRKELKGKFDALLKGAI